MRIGIIGAGNIGGALAHQLAGHGHQIRLANSRGPDTLTELVNEIDGEVIATEVADAARGSEVVAVAIPFGRYRELPADAFAGKIVVDANNYYPQRDGAIADLDADRATSSELLAAHLPGARVVKAFNTIYAGHLRERGRPDAPESERLAIPLAGDDADAKRVVAGLIREIGFAPVDAGTLADSRRQQPGTPVYGAEVGPDEARKLLDQAG
jgi:predicted dinucleotide-binding enzyme